MGRTRVEARAFRKQRVRRKVTGSTARPRLAVYRSLQHIYAQVVDDSSGSTLVAASTAEKGLRGDKLGASLKGAKRIGALIAERALQKQITQVVFDRGCFLYHGRIKAVADAAREKGLAF